MGFLLLISDLKTRMDEILEILLCANETKQEIKVEILQVLKI